MLETLFNKNISFPVGRVEYKVLRPVSFPEFLEAMNEKEALKYLQEIPAPAFTHPKLLQLFHTYALIGGMPGNCKIIIAANRDLTALSPVYDSLTFTAYIEDVQRNMHPAPHRFCISGMLYAHLFRKPENGSNLRVLAIRRTARAIWAKLYAHWKAHY